VEGGLWKHGFVESVVAGEGVILEVWRYAPKVYEKMQRRATRE